MTFRNEYLPIDPIEPQTLFGVWDDRTVSRHLIDLRPLTDDRTVLRNPHKGWFFHYVDNGFGRPEYRDKHPAGDYLEDFPAMNHLYLRIDWSDVEVERGVYDFSKLDAVMDEWGPHGFSFAMGMCCFEAYPAIPFATPRYVFEDGARVCRTPRFGYQPDYGDPIFLERLERFLEVMGKRYNGDPRIEVIDIGTYGTWGEGHTVFGDGIIPPVSVVKKHYDLHAKYFPDTYLACNDDHIVGRIARGADEVNEILDYAVSRGFGLQDDSALVGGYAQGCGYDSLRAPWAFELLGEHAPNIIECDHYDAVTHDPISLPRGGLTLVEALKTARATFGGFHWYPREWLANERHVAEYAGNRLGYWLFLPFIKVPPLQNTAWNAVTFCMENHGFAGCYRDYEVTARLRGANGEKTVLLPDVRLSEIGAGGKKEFETRLDLRGLPEGEYEFSIGIRDTSTGRPVRLGMKPDTFDGAYHTLTRVRVSGV
ncbi:MAG: DUF4832 domain-containing protein [Clostridia bacterium]|nr:DUF4832 domain-containing protein [Clostridia bacterium]